MKKIKVIASSNISHGSQIITGFLMLRNQGYEVEVIDQTEDASNPFYDLPVVLAEYRGKKLFYDLWDGYNNPEDAQRGLDWCDFCFRRSFDEKRNAHFFGEDAKKIHPLGFNYHLTCKDDPIHEVWWKALVKPFLGRMPDKYFTYEKFEGKPMPLTDEPPKILFLTRLWAEEPDLPEEVNAERRQINQDRIAFIRTLKERYGDAFLGGLQNMPIARELAPDLIAPKKYTERRHYLRLLHSSDICIGTIGLFESIGWKTAEYVAAAKAIVNERLHYTVPGDFREGVNYLSFETTQECLDAVEALVQSPEKRLAMQQANASYYAAWMKPDVMIKHTLELVDAYCNSRPDVL